MKAFYTFFKKYTLKYVMKIILLIILSVFLSCSEISTSEIISSFKEKKLTKTYVKEIKRVKTFSKTNSYNQDIAFMIDYSLHSGKNRFFIVDLKNDSIISNTVLS